MSSHECLQKIKADKKLENVHVIIYSGYAPQTMQGDFLALGADKFVAKPSNSDDLEKALRDLLAQ